jgi:hypothetical protein
MHEDQEHECSIDKDVGHPSKSIFSENLPLEQDIKNTYLYEGQDLRTEYGDTYPFQC